MATTSSSHTVIVPKHLHDSDWDFEIAAIINPSWSLLQLKHEKAVIRRKGQVRDVQVPKTSYGGETSGIRTNISRSVRFQY